MMELTVQDRISLVIAGTLLLMVMISIVWS